MNKTDLISYLSELKELETLLFLNKHFKSLYLNDCNEKEPEKPDLKNKYILGRTTVYDLEKPKEPEEGNFFLGLLLIASIPVMIFLVKIFWEVNDGLLGFLPNMFLTICAIFIGFFALIFGLNNILNKATYKEQTITYKTELEKFEKKIQEIDAENENKLNVYKKAMKSFSEEKNKILNQIDALSFEIEKKLNSMYQEEIVYPKYRNFVSICAFCEYLECGRCESLDGQNGAYNLYEQELRRNIIISQLSQIMNDIEEIKNSQYCLYQQLKQSTEYAEKLLENIKDEIALNNYFMESVAKVHGTFLYK